MENPTMWRGHMDKYGLKKLDPGDTTTIPFENRKEERLIRKAVDNRNARAEYEWYSVRKGDGFLTVMRKR